MTHVCTYCGKEYTTEALRARPLLSGEHGGIMVYGRETHEYRVCTCGCHVLIVIKRQTPAPLPAQPAVALFAEASHDRRK